MKNFFIGFLTFGIGVPLLTGLANIWNQIVEYICAYFAVKVYKYNQELTEMGAEEECCHHVIGFTAPDEEEEYDDDEE